MNKTNFLLIITFLLISCLEDSEPPVTVGGISGTVYNSQTMEVVQGVTITTMPTTSSIITGADGRFEIVDVPEGEYSLTASHPNYEVKTTTVQVIADRTVSVDLQLNSIGPELSVSENELNFGIETDNLTFHIQNTGIGTMNWSLTKKDRTTVQKLPITKAINNPLSSTFPASSFLPSPYRRAVIAWTPMFKPPKVPSTSHDNRPPRPVAASAAAPRRPTIAVSTTFIRVWEIIPRTTGPASFQTSSDKSFLSKMRIKNNKSTPKRN